MSIYIIIFMKFCHLHSERNAIENAWNEILTALTMDKENFKETALSYIRKKEEEVPTLWGICE